MRRPMRRRRWGISKPTPQIWGMPRRLFYAGIAASTVTAIALVMAVTELNTYYFRDLIALRLYNTRPNRIPCAEWPSLDTARRIVAQRMPELARITALDPDAISWQLWEGIASRECPGQGGLTIEAPGIYRPEIEAIIGDTQYFYGVPVQVFNTNWY